MLTSLLIALALQTGAAAPAQPVSRCEAVRRSWTLRWGAAAPRYDGAERSLDGLIDHLETADLRFDADCNGRLDVEEWRAREWFTLSFLDGDGDGRISRGEYLAFQCREGPSPRECARMWEPSFRRAAGSPGARFIDQDGYRGESLRWFRRYDRNGDGALTPRDRGYE